LESTIIESKDYTYDVPFEVIYALCDSLSKCQTIKQVKLNLGGIEDSVLDGFDSILAKFENKLDSLSLEAACQNVSPHAMDNLCQTVKRYVRKFKAIKINPRNYTHTNVKLLEQILS